MSLYRNRKTGGTYEIVLFAIDCTNGRNEGDVVVYREHCGSVFFVRDKAEFEQKFEDIEEDKNS